MKNIKNIQKSRLVKALSSYLAFVFVVLQVVDIISEPFSFSENLIVYLVYFFGLMLLLVIFIAIRLDSKTIDLKSSEKSFAGNKIISISLSVIFALIILNVYQYINAKETNFSKKNLNYGEIIINSKPDEASVKFAKVDSSGNIIFNYKNLGITPLTKTLETGNYLLKIEKNKLNSLLYNIEVISNNVTEIDAFLIKEKDFRNMVFIPSGESIFDTTIIINKFYIDKMEVSNENFLNFIINRGYEKEIFWPEEMNIKGEILNKDKALEHFVDKSGNHGPREWSGSMYPTGEGQKPVTGITWYEANAYAKFVGKRLPSFEEWWRAALGNPNIYLQEKLIRQMNFGQLESGKINKVMDNIAGLSEFGALNMAGNVREWTNTFIDNNKVIYVGGSWKDPEYIFDPNWRDSYPPYLSDNVIGFRCAY